MRRLAFVLVLLVSGVYYLPDLVTPPGRMVNVASGALPRVASLKSAGPEGAEELVSGEKNETFCARLGWIETAELARSLMDKYPLAEEAGFKVEEVEINLPPLHWVLIPPQPEEVALRQFRDIRRQGIDSYLITKGENRNAISLGLFESRESAISVLKEKKRQNLNAVLANFPRNQISYAITFEAEPELAEKLVQAVKEDYGSNFDFVEIGPCESIATPEKNP
jgi:hypothetical protein